MGSGSGESCNLEALVVVGGGGRQCLRSIAAMDDGEEAEKVGGVHEFVEVEVREERKGEYDWWGTLAVAVTSEKRVGDRASCHTLKEC